MGILNVTPDSFSDGGRFASLDRALEQAERLITEGADILDVGGESTRPFAPPVDTAEEIRRVIPVITGIRRHHTIPISIDTTKAAVAREALAAGADIINDISALRHDAHMLEVVQESAVPVILMHMLGTPSTMQVAPRYDEVVADIIGFFQERIAWLTAKGIDKRRLIVDPGIGFGKSVAHNLSLLKHLEQFSAQLDLPVMLGHSRKRFLGEITGIKVEAERDMATAVVAALCAGKGITMMRVHNVAATRQALQVAAAIAGAA
jgi:dihydropteroate synthase